MEFIFIIIILIMSVVIHEVSHGYAALALGDPTAKYAGRLTLNPLNHLDLVGSFIVPVVGYLLGGIIIGWAKPVPFNPYNLKNQKWGEALVAVAGPIANIMVALVFGFLLRVFSHNGILPESFVSLAGYLIFINIILAVFNLIPVPPLDGSKILFSILSPRFLWIRQSVESYGLVLIFLVIFFAWQFIFPLANYLFNLIIGSA